jgi:hypothetical protein
MKKISILLFVLFAAINSFAQYSGNQNLGGANTLVAVNPNGALQGNIIVKQFADTTAANLCKCAFYDGNIMQTGTIFWLRWHNAWYNIANQGASNNFPDGFVSEPNGILLVDSTVTLTAPITVRRNNVDTTITTNQVFVINSVPVGYTQQILIYEAPNGSVSALLGIPDTTNAVLPAMPAGGIQLTTITVNGDTIVKPVPSISSNYWNVAGNNFATPDVSLMGTLNARALRIITAGLTRIFIDSVTGNVGIGTLSVPYRLNVPYPVQLNNLILDDNAGYKRLFSPGKAFIQANAAGNVSQVTIGNDIGTSWGGANASLLTLRAFIGGQTGTSGTAILNGIGDNGVEKFRLNANGQVGLFGLGINTGTRTLKIDNSGYLFIDTTTGGGGSPTTFFADSLTGQRIDSVTKTIYNDTLPAHPYALVNQYQLSQVSGGSSWSLTGNAGTNPTTDFIGTTDAQPFIIKSNNSEIAKFEFTSGGFDYDYRISMGDRSIAGFRSVAIGQTVVALEEGSTALGSNTRAIGVGSLSTGVGTVAYGESSSSMGFNTVAKSLSSLVLGRYNDTTSLTNGDTLQLLAIGNGYNEFSRSNAMTILRNGSVGIGITTPDASAALDISSTTKGLLIPRMTTAQRNAIPSPANGLQIFNTDNLLFYYWNNGTWSPIGSAIIGSFTNSLGAGGVNSVYSDTYGDGLLSVAYDGTGFFGDGQGSVNGTSLSYNDPAQTITIKANNGTSFIGTISTSGYTVATLPAGTIGMQAYVTDALLPSFLATVTGGGAVVTPVFYNGTNWVAH